MRRQTDLEAARRSIRACLDTLEVLPVDGGLLERAYRLSGRDFEDDVQIACAVSAGLDAIVTRDPRGYVDSPIAVLSPDELLRQLGIQAQDSVHAQSGVGDSAGTSRDAE